LAAGEETVHTARAAGSAHGGAEAFVGVKVKSKAADPAR